MHDQLSMAGVADELEARIRANRLMELPFEWQDEVIYPYYNGLSIMNIAQSIMDLLGVEVDKPLDNAVWGDVSVKGQVDRVVLVLTDGLGYKLMQEMMAEDDEFHETIREITDERGPVPLTSTVPSTTAVALPTLWTGVSPGTHGMVGTSMYLREFSMLGDMLSYSPVTGEHPPGIFDKWGMDGSQFVTVPSVADRLKLAGVPSHLHLLYSFANTGLSKILHRGVTELHPHVGLNDAWERLREVLIQTRGERCYVSAYTPNVDALSHMYGHQSPHVKSEIKHQMSVLRDILADAEVHDGHTLVMIAADHGHIDTSWTLDVDQDEAAEPLREAMRMAYGGDSSFTQLYLRDGYRQRVINLITREFADHFGWIEPHAAIHAGLFGDGDIHPELEHRLGDLILLARVGVCLLDRIRPKYSKSWHTGLSDWEMLVPLLWKVI